MNTIRVRFIGSLLALGALAACGGSSTSPSSVTVIVRDGGTAGANGATITITAGGVSSRAVVIAAGQTVTFVNSDNRAHEMASDPHPQHGSCPSMEAGLGSIAAGQTKVTHTFANAGTCGFHDHLDAGNSALTGTITIQ